MNNGKRKYARPLRLAALDAPMSEVWSAYEQVVGQTTDTLEWLLRTYGRSRTFSELAPSTRSGYEAYADTLINKELSTGKRFGEIQLKNITRIVIQRYLDGAEGKIAANRHIQYLKAAWNWALNRYENIPENPCIGVPLNKQVPRTRYIEDWEYDLVFSTAKSMQAPYFAPAMELSYLCRARRSEVFQLSKEDLIDKGVFLNRGKGSKSEITLWTPRLHAAVELCKTNYPGAKSILLLHDRDGRPFTKNTLDSAWRRVINKAKGLGLVVSFTFHDIKAKGISDHKNKAGGHKSEKMKAIYDRVPEENEGTR
jgi:integrase